MKIQYKIIRLMCLTTLSIIFSACQNGLNTRTIPITETAVSTIVQPVPIQTTSSPYPTDSSSQSNTKCQELHRASDPVTDLQGLLLYGKKTIFDNDRFNQIYVIQIPDLEERTFLVADGDTNYSSPKISADGKYLAILKASDLLLIEAIEIYSANGELIASLPWDNDNWALFYGWANNENLVIGQYGLNAVLIINPFSGTKKLLTVETPDRIRIRGFDSTAQIFAFGYENLIDPREIDRTAIWNSNANQIVHTFDNQAEKPSELKWSHRGELIATTNRNEIFLFDNQGNAIERFDFSHNNILIWRIEWSSNDEQIFFWGWDRDLSDTRDVTQTYSNTGDFLYEIDIADKQIKSYCLSSKIFESDYSDLRNKNYWVSISPNYFVTENYTEYNSSNNIYHYDVLLVDRQSNNAWKLGEQLDLIGWMPASP